MTSNSKIFKGDKYAVWIPEEFFYLAFAAIQWELQQGLNIRYVFREVVSQTMVRQILDVNVAVPLLKINSTQSDIDKVLELFKLFQNDSNDFVEFLNLLCNLNKFPRQARKFRNIINKHVPGSVQEIHSRGSCVNEAYKDQTTHLLASANSVLRYEIVDETITSCNMPSTKSLNLQEPKPQVRPEELHDQLMETEPLQDSLHQSKIQDVEAAEKKPLKKVKKKIEKENEPKKKETSKSKQSAKRYSAYVLGCVGITAVGTAACLQISNSNRQISNTSMFTHSNFASNNIWQTTPPASYFRASDIDIHVQQVQNGLKKYSFTPKNSSRFGKPYSRN